MLTGMATTNNGISSTLFSNAQQRLLALMLGDPGRSYDADEILRLAGADAGTVPGDLETLTLAGILTLRKTGGRKHYQADRSAPLFDELRALIIKSCGVADALRAALSPLATRIDVAFIYGSVAKGTDKAGSDIDIIVISSAISYADVIPHLITAAGRIGRRINPGIYSADELKRKLAFGNRFVLAVLEQPKIFLTGSEDDIPRRRE